MVREILRLKTTWLLSVDITLVVGNLKNYLVNEKDIFFKKKIFFLKKKNLIKVNKKES